MEVYEVSEIISLDNVEYLKKIYNNQKELWKMLKIYMQEVVILLLLKKIRAFGHLVKI